MRLSAILAGTLMLLLSMLPGHAEKRRLALTQMGGSTRSIGSHERRGERGQEDEAQLTDAVKRKVHDASSKLSDVVEGKIRHRRWGSKARHNVRLERTRRRCRAHGNFFCFRTDRGAAIEAALAAVDFRPTIARIVYASASASRVHVKRSTPRLNE